MQVPPSEMLPIWTSPQVMPAGRMSHTREELASAAPLLVTSTRYSTVSLAATCLWSVLAGKTVPVLLIWRTPLTRASSGSLSLKSTLSRSVKALPGVLT